MKKFDLGQTVSILANLGVVVGIVFLGMEVRQNNELLATQVTATQAVSIQTASALDQEFLLAVAADPVTVQMWATYLTAPETLPPEQRLQGAYLITSVVRRLENVDLQRRLGSLSKEGWESRQALFIGIARSRGFSDFLESPPATLISEEFLDYMVQLSANV